MSPSASLAPCDEWAMMLHNLLDGELDAAHVARCEEHVATCAGCAAELARLRALRGVLGRDDVRWRAPDALRARVLDDIVRHDGVRVRRGAGLHAGGWGRFIAGLQRWSLAASLAVLAASLFIVLTPLERGGQLPDDLVAGHVRSLLADHLTDVASSNRHVVKPWFVGKVDFAPPVIDLRDEGFPLIGGRVDYIDEHVAAALVYRRHKHIINLFIWPANGTSSKSMTREGYNLVNWTRNGLTFWAVSDVDADELKQFRQALTAAAPH